MFEIIDEYGYSNYDYLNEVIEYTLKKLDSNGLLNVVLIDDNMMHKMNLTYRGIDRTTDVLSFAFNDNKRIETEINVLGDIYISIPKMKAQSIEYGHSEKRELSFLTIHGLLHLHGYDHMNETDELEMFSLQKQILKELEIGE